MKGESSFWKYWYIIIVIVFLLNAGIKYYGTDIINKANQLNDDYKQKLDSSNEIDAIVAGEVLTSYLKENQDVLNYIGAKNWVTDTLLLIAKNRVIMEQNKKVAAENSAIQEQNQKNEGIFSNANRLNDDYNWKLNLVTEIQQRTDALGRSATREYYVEWMRRNNEAIDSGERLATYLEENREVLDSGTIKNWASNTLTRIAENKITFERDNQILNQVINQK